MTLFVDWARLPDGWHANVRIELTEAGRIASVVPGTRAKPDDKRFPGRLLVAAPANLHSHAFQRAMAGHTEQKGTGEDSFWTWRDVMYRFVHRLSPDHVEAIAAFAYMEMLESGFGSVGEFHYLHHQPDGRQYDDPAEMANRIVNASMAAGIGLTLLPVLYSQGGVDGRPLSDHQLRFGNSMDTYQVLQDRLKTPQDDGHFGVAAHSLRAIRPADLKTLPALAGGRPCHIHIAEQKPEIREVEAGLGARPVRWLLDNLPVDETWCLVHATHMTPDETLDLAKSGAVAGICPITEANLGDGIFDGARYAGASGALGFGSDSHIRIDLSEELRTYEYSQRLKDTARAVSRPNPGSVGDFLLENAVLGGAQALGRRTGKIEPGNWADLLFLDAEEILPYVPSSDCWLDHWIFVSGSKAVKDVWSAGRECVSDGRHIHRDTIQRRFTQTMADLLEDL